MPRYREICNIARIIIDTLNDIGITHCCFIGGMACKLYTDGKRRKPKDLDILCLTRCRGGADAIKTELCRENSRFYLKDSTLSGATHKILFWRTSDDPDFEKFKIDILVPGELDLPFIQPRYLVRINKFPCAPLALLLLHKLQAWDHRRKRRPHEVDKIIGDIRDVGDLLRLANQRNLRITKSRPYISDSFRGISYKRIVEFCEKYPRFESLWKDLGFDFDGGI